MNNSKWPSYSELEADAVRDVLLSNKVNYWTGDEGRQFESEFAKWVGSKYAVAETVASKKERLTPVPSHS